MELTPRQRRRLEKFADLPEDGDVAMLDHLCEIEETFEEKIDEVKASVSEIKEELKKKLEEELVYEVDEEKIAENVLSKIPPIKDGEDYVLTDADKMEIALCIDVPIVEKETIVEKTEVIKEQPIVTNEVKEVAKYEAAEVIVEKINALPTDTDDHKIDKLHIKGLDKMIEQDTLDRAVSILDQRTSFLINKVNDVKDSIPAPTDLSGYVPYTGATEDVDLGVNDLTANALIKTGGLSTEFLKADGSVDSSTYITDLSSFDTDDLAEGSTNLYSQWATVSNRLQYTAQPISTHGHFFNIDTSVPSTLTVALAGAGAGNVDNGAHQYVVTFYNEFGESLPSSQATATVVDKTTDGQVSISNIPISARADVIGRKIYRSAVNGTFTGGNRWYLLTTITNNTATTYTDNIADGTINVQANQVIFLNTDPTYYPTWDSGFRAGSYTPMVLNNQGDVLFRTQTGATAAWFNGSDGKFTFGNPARPKDTVTGGSAVLYVSTDANNSAVNATYITSPGSGTRFFIGDSGHQPYSVNWRYVPRFESFPPEVAWGNSSTNSQGDGVTQTSQISGSASTGYFILYSGTFTSFFTGSLASNQMRSLPFTVFPRDTDGFVREAAYIFRHASNSANWSNPHTRWATSDLTILDMAMTGSLTHSAKAGATVVFNETGVDADFRIEGDTDANLFFVDASADTVQIGSATTADSAKFYVNGKISTSGEMEINGDLNHDGTNIGFFGGAPTTQQTALTTQLTDITFTAPGTPDYAIQDLVDSASGSAFGFATKDEGNTVLSVIKNLQTRVQELEDKLQAYSLLA